MFISDGCPLGSLEGDNVGVPIGRCDDPTLGPTEDSMLGSLEGATEVTAVGVGVLAKLLDADGCVL